MTNLRQMPAEEVRPGRHYFVNKPGDTPHVFTVHAVTGVDAHRVRIEYGGTHVVCPRTRLVLITAEPDHQ